MPEIRRNLEMFETVAGALECALRCMIMLMIPSRISSARKEYLSLFLPQRLVPKGEATF